jgi:hypothetical protein
MEDMTDPNTDLSSLLERIALLERRLRRLRRGGAAVVIFALSAMLLGASATGPATSLRAREFVLVDSNDQPRAVLGFRDDGAPRLNLLAQGGESRARLELLEDGSPGLVFSDHDALDIASFGATADGSSTLSLKNADGHRRAELSLLTTGTATLAFRNEAEHYQAALSMTKGGTAGLLLSDHQGRNRLAAEVKADGHPEFRLIGPDGTTQWNAY